MRKTAKEIELGKDLVNNLSVYAAKMMAVYNNYSAVRLSMNYFTYYEMVMEVAKKSDTLSKIMDDFNDIVLKGIVEKKNKKETQELILQLEDIRKQVINIMNGLTSYVDIFNIYEYCLNRVQYRFEDGSVFLEESAEEISVNTLKYILSEQDNVVINSKIVEVVRQLPIRMTKNKFFEYLSEGIRVYKGSEVSSVDDFLYMLKTSSMIEISPYVDMLSEDMMLIYNEFKKQDFSEITKEKYEDLRAKHNFAVSYITDEVNIYLALGELINDVYVMLMSSPYVLEETREHEICNGIIKKVNNLFTEKEEDEVYESITEDFVNLEGVQESCYEMISKYDYIIELAIEENGEVLKEAELMPVYDYLKKIVMLESGSVFVEFDKKNTETATDEYIEKVTNNLITLLREVFKSNEKLVNRAIMAHVLSGLPVFFNNTSEIKDYIFNSINQCSNDAERAAVAEILAQLRMEQ